MVTSLFHCQYSTGTYGYVGVEGKMNSSVVLDDISITFFYVLSSDLSENNGALPFFHLIHCIC